MKPRPYIQYNVKDFLEYKSNLLFIAGLSASGKSTIAKALAKSYNAIHIPLDMVFNKNESCISCMSDKSHDLFMMILEDCGFYKDNDFTPLWRDNRANYRTTMIITSVINHFKETRIIIEGVQLYLYPNIIDLINNESLMIITTSKKDCFSAYKERLINRKTEISKIISDKRDMNYYNSHWDRLGEFVMKIKERRN